MSPTNVNLRQVTLELSFEGRPNIKVWFVQDWYRHFPLESDTTQKSRPRCFCSVETLFPSSVDKSHPSRLSWWVRSLCVPSRSGSCLGSGITLQVSLVSPWTLTRREDWCSRGVDWKLRPPSNLCPFLLLSFSTVVDTRHRGEPPRETLIVLPSYKGSLVQIRRVGDSGSPDSPISFSDCLGQRDFFFFKLLHRCLWYRVNRGTTAQERGGRSFIENN